MTASRAARLGVGEDAADEVVDDALLGERQRGAAAVGLVVPVDGLAADGLGDLVHVRRVLGVVGQRDLRRPGEQAAVVAGDLEAGERPGHLGVELVEADGVVVDVDEVVDGDAAVVGAADHGTHVGRRLLALGDFVGAGLEAAVAGGARDGHRVELHVLLDLGELVDGQRHAQQAVDASAPRCCRSTPSPGSPGAPGRAPGPSP